MSASRATRGGSFQAVILAVAVACLGCSGVSVIDHWHCGASATVRLATGASKKVDGGGNDDHFRSAASKQAIATCEGYVEQALAGGGGTVETPCAVTYCQENPPSIW